MINEWRIAKSITGWLNNKRSQLENSGPTMQRVYGCGAAIVVGGLAYSIWGVVEKDISMVALGFGVSGFVGHRIISGLNDFNHG